MRHAVGGTSCLHRRARPSTAFLNEEPIPVTMILPPSASRGARRSGGGDVRVSPRNKRSHSVVLPSSLPVVAGYEWVRDNVLKYRSSITSAVSIVALECQLKLAKMVIQSCGSDDFPFLRATSGCPSFFLMYHYF